MALLPDAGIETIEDKLKTVLKLRSATVNDVPVLMHMARALAEQQGLAQLMTATAAGWRRDLGQAFDATVAAIIRGRRLFTVHYGNSVNEINSLQQASPQKLPPQS